MGPRYRFFGRVPPPRFFTTPFASRTARPSFPVRFRTELATSRHCRFALGDLAFFVCFGAEDGVQGNSGSPVVAGARFELAISDL